MNMENGGGSLSGGNGREIEAVVFQGDRMRAKAKEIVSQGRYEASWENPEGEESGLKIYVVPLEKVDDTYLSGFERLFNHIRDESGEYGIFLGTRKEGNENPEEGIPAV